MLKHDKCAPFEAEINSLKTQMAKRESLFIQESSEDKKEIQKLRCQKIKLIEALESCLILNPLDPFNRLDTIRKVLSEVKE